MNKFKTGQEVRFKDDEEIYKVVRFYPTETGFKYDVINLTGKKFILAMPENTLNDIYQYQKPIEIMVDPEAANLPKWQKKEPGFPEGMEDELVRLGNKKKDSDDEQV